MNFEVLGEFARDQKIKNGFQACGYSKPAGTGGRRLWAKKLLLPENTWMR